MHIYIYIYIYIKKRRHICISLILFINCHHCFLDGWIKTDVGQYKIFNLDYHGICSEIDGCTWDESKRVCEQEGGYLTKITSQEENDKIKGLLKSVFPLSNCSTKIHFHLGLNDIEDEGVYRWTSDDSTMSYDNFYRGNV